MWMGRQVKEIFLCFLTQKAVPRFPDSQVLEKKFFSWNKGCDTSAMDQVVCILPANMALDIVVGSLGSMF
jgi:hypothetical protein